MNEIVLLARELELQVADLDARFPHLRGNGWSIEFCFWYEEPCDTIELQVRGIHNPTEVFDRLKKDLQARIFDMHGGKFIEDELESGFEDWRNFTEKVMNSIKSKDIEVFDTEWIRVYKAVESMKNAENYPEAEKENNTKIREQVFRKLYEFTNDSDLAGYVSDDFGLISDARLLGYKDLWLDELIACYEKGIIPRGSL